MKLQQIVREETVRAFAPPEHLPYGGVTGSGRYGRGDGAPVPQRHAYFCFAASAAFAVESGEVVSVLHLEDGHLSGDHLWVVKVELAGQTPRYFAGLALPVREEVSARWVEAVIDDLPDSAGTLLPAESLGLGWTEGDHWVTWTSRALFARDIGEGKFSLPEGIVRKDAGGIWQLAGSSNAHYVGPGDVGLDPALAGWSYQTSRTFTGRQYGWWEKTVDEGRRRLLLNEGPLKREFPLREIRERRIRVVHPEMVVVRAAFQRTITAQQPAPQGVKRVRKVAPPPASVGDDEFVEVVAD